MIRFLLIYFFSKKKIILNLTSFSFRSLLSSHLKTLIVMTLIVIVKIVTLMNVFLGMTRGNASGFWSLTVLPGGQGFLGRLGAPRDLFEFWVRGCSWGFLRGSFGRA